MLWLWQLELSLLFNLLKILLTNNLKESKPMHFYKQLKKMYMLLEMLLHILIGILASLSEFNITMKQFIKVQLLPWTWLVENSQWITFLSFGLVNLIILYAWQVILKDGMKYISQEALTNLNLSLTILIRRTTKY